MRIARILFLIPVMVYACTTQEVCEKDLKAEAIATFKTLHNGLASDTVLSGVSLYGIRNNLNDSLLYDSVRVSKVYLPLNPNQEWSIFVLRIQNIIDTIHIYHSSTAYLVSYTCGFSSNFEISSVHSTRNNIKNVELINNEVYAEENEITEHFRLYF